MTIVERSFYSPQTLNGHIKKGSDSLIPLLGGTTAKWSQIGAALTFLGCTFFDTSYADTSPPPPHPLPKCSFSSKSWIHPYYINGSFMTFVAIIRKCVGNQYNYNDSTRVIGKKRISCSFYSKHSKMRMILCTLNQLHFTFERTKL